MKNIKRFTLSLAALLMVSGLAMTAPAAARADTRGTNNQIADDTTANTSTQASNTLAEQFREQAKAKIEAQRQNVKQRTEAEREKACTARKANLTKRMSDAVAAAIRHKTVIDAAYSRVKDFHDSKNLSVADYARLTATIDTAQAQAQTDINVLSALNVNVDCSSQTVASSVGAFQTAVKSTRDSLKAYRTALVKLIESLKGASTGTSTTQKPANSTGQ
jgi:hypothetical protein